jgi:HTH-type transcriptional regulator/antitoxin HigA
MQGSRPIAATTIKSRRDYKRALDEIESLMSAARDTQEGDRLDALVAAVEAWEAEHVSLVLPRVGGH